jgi:predicted Abi (CAAX) family protease
MDVLPEGVTFWGGWLLLFGVAGVIWGLYTKQLTFAIAYLAVVAASADGIAARRRLSD